MTRLTRRATMSRQTLDAIFEAERSLRRFER
jgi:hypothetical protein